MEKTDQQLISDYLSGDENALSEIIGRYLKPIFSFIYRLTSNPQDAQDITQETFIKAWRNLKKYKTGESFRTWIFTIAHNTAIDWLRKKRNLVFSDFENSKGENFLEENIADTSLLPDEIIIQNENKQLIEDALSKLPPTYKEVIILHYMNELTFDEIGQVLKKPLNTVKSQHRRALLALKNILNAPKIKDDSY
jgi:RNA polymerase sigma-70 factor (ECF subfamily)